MSTGTTAGDPASRARWAGVAALLLTAVLVAAALYAGTRLDADAAAVPTDSSVDAGFARDMQRHHSQAVQMSLSLLQSSRDDEVRTLATDIMLTQQQQVGQMYAWLQSWGLSQSGGTEPMAWMSEDSSTGQGHDMEGHDMSGMAEQDRNDAADAGDTGMPGMASDRQLQALDRAAPGEVDQMFLRLMIPHHRGALGMAEHAADFAQSPDVRRLAETIVTSQTSEINVLQDMLAERAP